jgi:hypothetical protein
MTAVDVESATAPERDGAPPTREVRHEYTRTFPALLDQLSVSLVVSTYQAGKVVAVGVAAGELTLSYGGGAAGGGGPVPAAAAGGRMGDDSHGRAVVRRGRGGCRGGKGLGPDGRG